MIEKRVFPKGLGIAFSATVIETNEKGEDGNEHNNISIEEYTFYLDGKPYAMKALQERDMKEGETVYMTPSGLVKCSNGEMPKEKFPTETVYWLIQRLSDKYIELEVEK